MPKKNNNNDKCDEKHFKRILNKFRNEVKEMYGELPHQDDIIEIIKDYSESYQAFATMQKRYRTCLMRKVGKEDREGKKQELDQLAEADAEQFEKALTALEPLLDQIELNKPPKLKLILLKVTMLSQEGPKGLAKFCDENPDDGSDLIMELLKNKEVMIEFMTHGGPRDGKWCHAYQLYKQLMPMVPEGDELYTECHKRLALAVVLEHAKPCPYRLVKDKFIDPIARFQHYVEAHKNGELDPAFGYFSTWEYRLIIDSGAPDEELAWGRKVLRNYRPDLATVPDTANRYSRTCGAEMTYGPLKGMSGFQDLLSGEGQCGPYAWFGRFINKAHGIPTWGCIQPNHATFTKWTDKSQGWTLLMTNTGCDWLQSWGYKDFGESGAFFRTEANARSFMHGKDGAIFINLQLLACMAEVYGEHEGKSKRPEFSPLHEDYLWRSLFNARLHLWSKQAKPKHFKRGPAHGEKDECGYECCHQQYIARKDKPNSDKDVETLDDGTIRIPALACKKDEHCVKMKSHEGGGGWQLYLQKKESFVKYKLQDDVPSKEYEISFKVCTVHASHEDEFMCVQVNNDAKEKVTVPYTIGEWEQTAKVKLTMGDGDALKITRQGKKCKGLSMKEILLTPC